MPKSKLPNWFLPEWRQKFGWSQEKLAAEAGFGNKSYVSLFESGKRRYSSEALEAFAKAFGCEPWEILNVNPLVQKSIKDLPPNVTSIVDTVKRVPEPDREEFIDTTMAALERLRKKPRKAAKRRA